ncbi:MAG TPA: HlyD family efflux transporter periplasmic adaptor subunit [Longimicrobiales bacterium]|nr:HlyD family efflux transporter periplasmic adaptor subunit [Longimicrobiales bacterium]
MMDKRLRIVIPAVVVVAAVVVWLLARNGAAEEGVIQASGTVEATEADLGFQLAGRVLEVVPQEGDMVAPGQELARLDLADQEAARGAARAQVDAAEARLAELRRGARAEELAQAVAAARAATERADDALRDAERARRLFEGGAVSAQALEKVETALQVAQATREQAEQGLAMVRQGPRVETIRAQEAVVDQAKANLARAEAMLANGVIAAPFPGRVTVRHREPGETVSPGAPVLTLLDPENRWVRIYVREDQIGAVQVGMEATIFSDTYPDKTYPGEVTFIGSEAEFTPRNVQTTEERIKLVYPVKVRITGDPGFELKPGIPVDVTLRAAGS